MKSKNIPEVTPRQAAKALGVTKRTVFNYIRKGKLTSRKEGRRVFIPIAEIEQLRMKLSLETMNKASSFPEKAPPESETSSSGSIAFQFDPSQQLIIERREYEALLVRLGHLENELKFLTHEPEGGKREESKTWAMTPKMWWLTAGAACIPIVLYLAWWLSSK